MFESNTQNPSGSDDWSIKGLDYEASNDVLSFFELLLEVDRRNNPDFYKSNKQSETSDR